MDDRTQYVIDAELTFARAKFPGNNLNFPALVEEVGELAKALLDHSFGKKPAADVYAEAGQVAAMAIRVMEEGSAEFPYAFEHGHYQQFDVNKLKQLSSHGTTVPIREGNDKSNTNSPPISPKPPVPPAQGITK